MLKAIVAWSCLAFAAVHVIATVMGADKDKTPAARLISLYAAFANGMAWWYLTQ